ncbi:hypothetical protein RDWZM_003455 [Blomia tropicalis]|uniref:Uncharacterized protein n=1 Tax=Blomia tropicalis TaxID=40697 RepID=A0A9Q0MFA7_BLOTA|nr:hypothetical protein RDWZM_003455 [Blomia tropicalis]
MPFKRILVLTFVLFSLVQLGSCNTSNTTTTNANGEPKLTLGQKIDSMIKTDQDIKHNLIPGSSGNYVPELSHPTLGNFVSLNNATNTTRSQANVYEATATSNVTQNDPLMVNAQSPNPFMARGVNPQIAMMLQNNPRLQMLARQNPLIAQQIMRNPQLLRDPQIQRAIQSQMSPGQNQNLLGQLGQIGLLRALNPLGLGLLNRGNNNNNMATGNQNLNQNPLNQNANRQNNLQGNSYGLPRNHQQTPTPMRNQQNLPGGFYGNNANYNPASENGNVEEDPNAIEGGGEGGGEGDHGGQDYDDNSGAGGGEEGNGEDSQQNPAEDPDIQQLQNFGGPVNDNFPEGLFPPGLLSKEDIEEIRKQQERQQKEAEERERQQQLEQQNQQNGGASPDYEDNGEGATGEEVNPEGAVHEGGEDGGNAVDHGGEEVANGHGHEPGVANGGVSNDGHAIGHQTPTPNVGGYTPNPTPPAYQNAYHPIQPQRVPMQPSVDYANDFHQGPTPPRNQFNHYQPGVQYDQATPYQGQYQMMGSTTPSPISTPYGQHGQMPISHQYGPHHGPQHGHHPPQPTPMYQQPHHHSPYPNHVQNRQSHHQPWQPSPPLYGSPNGGHSRHPQNYNRNIPFGNNGQGPNHEQPYHPHSGLSTPASAYRPNSFNEPRQFQQRPRSFL